MGGCLISHHVPASEMAFREVKTLLKTRIWQFRGFVLNFLGKDFWTQMVPLVSFMAKAQPCPLHPGAWEAWRKPFRL